MIKIENSSISKSIEGIQLFEDDLDILISMLTNNFLTIEIYDDTNFYDNIKEVKKYKGNFPEKLNIKARNTVSYETIELDFEKKKVKLHCRGSETMYNFGHVLIDFLKNRRPIFLRIFRYRWLCGK